MMTEIVPPIAIGRNVKPAIPGEKLCGRVKTIGYASNIK